FNPSKSLTYSPSCREPCYFDDYCNKCKPATYSVSYADKSFSSGTVGSDMVIFETGDEGITLLTNIEFGCAHDPCYNGVLGLGT
ncbi:aspartic proteinase CDR1-like, partial [Trifolium medium]|nr:aspartic proteinase CDR1-like [Trifolium medium]